MEITKITFIVANDSIDPLLFAALEAEIECLSMLIVSLNSFRSGFQAFVAETALSFIFEIISSWFVATRTLNTL